MRGWKEGREEKGKKSEVGYKSRVVIESKGVMMARVGMERSQGGYQKEQ